MDLHGGILAKLRQVGTLGGEAKGPTPRLVKLQPPVRAALPVKQFNAALGRHTEVVVMVVVIIPHICHDPHKYIRVIFFWPV